ncbi:MAG: MmgE/PrpD family protein [Actinomycetes bacterium]
MDPRSADPTGAPAPGDVLEKGPTGELAQFIASLSWSDIPEDVTHQAKRCFIDWLGVTLAGSADPSAEIVLSLADEMGSDESATVVGSGRRVPLGAAALANGFLAHVQDYDDTYNPARTTVHGSAPVWPVVLALGERSRLDGCRALAAFVAGFETQIRVALAAGPSHYEAGWHVTGTVGHLGAAAAAASVLSLPPAEVAHALGAAATQAAGLKGVYGTMGKALHPGKAAMDGLLAALLARRGFTATTSILERPRGFLEVMSPDPQPELAATGLGETWTLRDNGFKPYPCGSLTHPTIEAVLGLRREHGLEPEQIESISAVVNDYVSWVTGKPEPETGLEAKFSIFHCAAVAAVDGVASIHQFEDVRVNDPAVVSMRGKVRIAVDDALPKDAASVILTLTDGRQLTSTVVHNKGTPDKPMPDAEVEEKFLTLASPLLGSDTARRVAELSWNLEECAEIAEVAELCRGQAR